MDTIIESVCIQNNINNCCICLDTIIDISYPEYCNCKIKMHKKCLELVELNGLKCPICRIKGLKKVRTNIYPNIFDTNKHLLERILSFPFWLFENYPSIITFLIMLSYSFIIATIFVLPIIMLHLLIKKN